MTLLNAPARKARAATLTGLALTCVAALLAGRSMLAPGFYDSHDGLLNVHRLFELEQCTEDGPFPCRWAPDMGYGYGTPLFVFYPPLATYVSLGFRALGASHIDAVKLAMLASFLFGALAMFGLAHRFFGPRGAVCAAVLYTWAPYRAVDAFARGALAEAWGIALLPLVFLAGERAMNARERRWEWGLACGLAWAAMLLTHNLTTLMAAPFYAAWCLLWLVSGARSGLPRTWRSLAPFALGHLLGFALAAGYVVPSLLEQPHAHTGTLSTLYAWARYENNFLSFGEVLLGSTPWGYGAFRQPGGISLFAGFPQWGLAFAACLAVVSGIALGGARRREFDASARATLLLGLAGAAALLMTVSVSKPVWDALPVLAFLQFPWRFLAVACVFLPFAAGWLVARDVGPPWLGPLLVGLLVTCVVAVGWSRFAPSRMIPVESEALANRHAIATARHGLFDFLPIGVDLGAVPKTAPMKRPPPVEAVSGEVGVRNLRRTSHAIAFDATVTGGAVATVRINVFDFPGWVVKIDDRVVPHRAGDPLGRITFEAPAGPHTVRASFERTPVRTFAEGVSAFAALFALGWGFLLLRAWRTRAG